MKILYIDAQRPSHNAELHIDFIKFMQDKGFCDILPYGNTLGKKFSNAINDTSHMKYVSNNTIEVYRRDRLHAAKRHGVRGWARL
jgi:hypothetical protein